MRRKGSPSFYAVLREKFALPAGQAPHGPGQGGAFAIRTSMQGQLYGVRALDPIVLGGVALVLAAIAFVACAVPARRASRIDPLIALTD